MLRPDDGECKLRLISEELLPAYRRLLLADMRTTSYSSAADSRASRYRHSCIGWKFLGRWRLPSLRRACVSQRERSAASALVYFHESVTRTQMYGSVCTHGRFYDCYQASCSDSARTGGSTVPSLWHARLSTKNTACKLKRFEMQQAESQHI